MQRLRHWTTSREVPGGHLYCREFFTIIPLSRSLLLLSSSTGWQLLLVNFLFYTSIQTLQLSLWPSSHGCSVSLSDLPGILSWFFFMYTVLSSLTMNIFICWPTTQILLKKGILGIFPDSKNHVPLESRGRIGDCEQLYVNNRFCSYYMETVWIAL